MLRRVFLNIERLKQNGDEFAPKLEKKLRIIVSYLPFKNYFVSSLSFVILIACDAVGCRRRRHSFVAFGGGF